MYCLSRDGLIMTKSERFYINKTRAYKNNLKGETKYCIYTYDGSIMDCLDTEAEAKEKLIVVMAALAAGVKTFEF